VVSEKETGLNQPSDPDLLGGRMKSHPAKDFAKGRAQEPNPEQQSDEDSGESSSGDAKRNYFSFSTARGWIKFNGGGPWLDKAGGPFLVALVVSGMVTLLAAAAWRLGLLWGQ